MSKKKQKPKFIPDADSLYRRIPPEYYDKRKNRILPPAFRLRQRQRIKEKGLSVNWEKYSSPAKTAKDPKSSRKFFVGAIRAKIPRNEYLEVNHKPTKNPAHSLIEGERLFNDKLSVSDALSQQCLPVITK
jgi:hypothetical protein